MNLHDFQLKYKVGILTLRTYFKKINSSLTIDNVSRINNDILIFFPFDENSCRIASYSFQTLNELSLRGINVKICLSKNLENLFKNISCEKILYNNKGNTIKSFPKEINVMKKYDMIIDLNPKPNIDISKKINQLNAGYKIGFKSKYSDSFYNIQIDMTDSKFLETSYGRIKKILKIS
ncbi:MAG: hypothetical protein H8E60_06560 [Candidatus Marinimicrobia bacterium]|nr:hypothetical protein [Candidatus Neomarinimicrobiota bacterium]